MERLTNENHKELGFCAYVGSQNPFEAPITIGELAAFLNEDYSPRKILEEVFAHLAAYEDTMPLERAQELVQAEKDGRLVVLPCKSGDELTINGRKFKANNWNVLLTAFSDDTSTPSGKIVKLFYPEEVEAELKKEGGNIQ